MTSLSWALRTERFPDGHWGLPRSEWGDGPWQTEPDLVEWRSQESPTPPPYPLLIIRGGMGQLNGYVGVPEGHGLYGKSRVLGCNWEGPCSDRRTPTGEPPTCWWLGFDCGHGDQYCPMSEALFVAVGRMTETALSDPETTPENYVTLSKCRERVEALATVFHLAASNPSLLEELL